jgi:hypothetical protein
VNFIRDLRKIAVFFRRDFVISRGYRGAFLLEILEAFFGVATFYYLSRFVQSPELSGTLPAGSSYFAFALVGFAFFDYLSVSLTAFDSSIEEARQNRTLEALLVTQTPLPVILASISAGPFCFLTFRRARRTGWVRLRSFWRQSSPSRAWELSPLAIRFYSSAGIRRSGCSWESLVWSEA